MKITGFVIAAISLLLLSACGGGDGNKDVSISIAISPTSQQVNAGANLTLSVTAKNTEITWPTLAAGQGSFTPNGNQAVYTAPMVTENITVQFTVTAAADTTRTATATITVIAPVSGFTGTKTLSGTVTDGATPLAGATVYIPDISGVTTAYVSTMAEDNGACSEPDETFIVYTCTDADGKFSLEFTLDGTLSVVPLNVIKGALQKTFTILLSAGAEQSLGFLKIDDQENGEGRPVLAERGAVLYNLSDGVSEVSFEMIHAFRDNYMIQRLDTFIPAGYPYPTISTGHSVIIDDFTRGEGVNCFPGSACIKGPSRTLDDSGDYQRIPSLGRQILGVDCEAYRVINTSDYDEYEEITLWIGNGLILALEEKWEGDIVEKREAIKYTLNPPDNAFNIDNPVMEPNWNWVQ